MNKSFRVRLKRNLMLGTIIPLVCFILMFAYKYFTINLNAEKDLFNEELNNFQENVDQVIAKNTNLLNTSVSFLSHHSHDNQMKIAYLNGLIANSQVISYYYSDNKVELTNQKKVTLPSEKISLVDDRLYLASFEKGLLVLEFDFNYVINSIEKYLDKSYQYNLYYKNQSLISQIDHAEVGDDLEWQLDKRMIIKKVPIPNSEITIIFAKDISGEISYIVRLSVIFLMFLFFFTLVMSQIVYISSKSLLRPLNHLIETVSEIAHDHIGSSEIRIRDDEYKEIYVSFDEMMKNVQTNIEKLNHQTLEIQDKNENMEEMNQQLIKSLEHLEASTKDLEILEKQTKTLVDHIKDLMWVIDPKGRIVYINNVVSDKLGYDVEDLIGVKLDNILYRDYKNEESFQEIFFDDFEDLELTFVTKNSEHEEIFSCSTRRLKQNDKLISIQGVCRDITEQRFIEAQMEQKNIISATLNEISEILTRPEKLEFLLKHIVVRIERLLDPLICTIRMVDDKGRLELKAGIGECYGLVQEKYLDIDRDISGKAIKEGKIIIISDKNADDYDNYEEIFSIIERSKELVFLPLEYDGTTIGVMSIGLREQLADSDLKILKVFTNQASAAIEKARMYEEIENNYLNIIKALASTVEAKDAYTENHSIRVSKYARMIAEELGLSEEEVGYIDIAGLLHDIGKIGISDLTLTKEGRLSDKEFEQIKKHPLNGGRIVSEMKLHQHIIDGVLFHHKRFDLKGYPEIDIDSLPLSARIIGVADAFDAMTSNRSYQKAKSFDQAIKELKACSGTQFCPEIVRVMEFIVIKLKRFAS